MNVPENDEDTEECARMHPGLLPREEDPIQYVPPAEKPNESSQSNTKSNLQSSGEDHRSVLSDSKITDVSKRKLSFLAKVKAHSSKYWPGLN